MSELDGASSFQRSKEKARSTSERCADIGDAGGDLHGTHEGREGCWEVTSVARHGFFTRIYFSARCPVLQRVSPSTRTRGNTSQ